MNTVYTSASDVAAQIIGRVAAIRRDAGFETDIGATVFDGNLAVNDGDVPCVSVIEGADDVSDAPGRVPVWNVGQAFVLAGYTRCSSVAASDTARAIANDLKRAIFTTNGKPDATLGGKVLQVHYRGKNIAPSADGAAIVMATVEIGVQYVDQIT